MISHSSRASFHLPVRVGTAPSRRSRTRSSRRLSGAAVRDRPGTRRTIGRHPQASVRSWCARISDRSAWILESRRSPAWVSCGRGRSRMGGDFSACLPHDAPARQECQASDHHRYGRGCTRYMLWRNSSRRYVRAAKSDRSLPTAASCTSWWRPLTAKPAPATPPIPGKCDDVVD